MEVLSARKHSKSLSRADFWRRAGDDSFYQLPTGICTESRINFRRSGSIRIRN